MLPLPQRAGSAHGYRVRAPPERLKHRVFWVTLTLPDGQIVAGRGAGEDGQAVQQDARPCSGRACVPISGNQILMPLPRRSHGAGPLYRHASQSCSTSNRRRTRSRRPTERRPELWTTARLRQASRRTDRGGGCRANLLGGSGDSRGKSQSLARFGVGFPEIAEPATEQSAANGQQVFGAFW